ncbi:MAG TPA: hypothetical protein VGV92_00540 [Gammaproteobacteria bacterium]|nr:hypothetical protein [Gammaproteobacteria bacterium]
MGLEHSINDFTRITAWLSKGQKPGQNPLLWSGAEGKVAKGAVELRGELSEYITQLTTNLQFIADTRATLNKPLAPPAEGQEEDPELPIKRDALIAELGTLENQIGRDLVVARELSDSLDDRCRASQSTLKSYAEQLQEIANRALSIMPGIKDLDKSTINDMKKLLTAVPSQNREKALKELATSRDPSGAAELDKKMGVVVAGTKEGAEEFKDRQDKELKRAMSYLDSVVKQVKALEKNIKTDNGDLKASVAKAANFFKEDRQAADQLLSMEKHLDVQLQRRAISVK